MDIFIARVQFPNDPTGTNVPHQLFVGMYISHICIEFYSISSILNKERRVYSFDGSINKEIALIVGNDQNDNGFRVPSFIDCSKSYTLTLDSSVNLESLNHRSITESLRSKIMSKIDDLKKEGNHTTYSISLSDFVRWNNSLAN